MDMRLFDNNEDSLPFGAGGSIGLSGGIETAIDASLCRRVTGLTSDDARYGAACAEVVRAVQDAADVWASRHPTLYFNLTEDIHDTDHAELVITSSFDEFVGAKRHNTIAFADAVCFPNQRSCKREITRGTGGASFSTVPRRGIIYLNPYHCFHTWRVAHVAEGCREGLKTPYAVAVLSCAVLGSILLVWGAVSVSATRGKHEAAKAEWERRDALRRFNLSQLLEHRANFDERLASAREDFVAAWLVMAAKFDLSVDLDGLAIPETAPAPPTPSHFQRVYKIIGCCLLLASVAPAVPLVMLIRNCGVAREGGVISSHTTHKCSNLQYILAHEIGHVLGLDHGDRNSLNIALRPEDGDASEFVHLNEKAPCDGLHVFKQPTCEDFSDAECGRSVFCELQEGTWHRECVSVFSRTLMAASAHDTESPLDAGSPPLTHDDLASLFFIYPAKRRLASWGVDRIPLTAYSLRKLLALREDFFPTKCLSVLDDRPQLAACLNRARFANGLEKLDLMELHQCRHDGTPTGPCAALRSLGHAQRHAMAEVDAAADGGNSEGVAIGARFAVTTAQRAAEAALPNAPTGLAAAAHAAWHGMATDADGDGVHDSDTDGDGLPDDIETGLAALAELMEGEGANARTGGERLKAEQLPSASWSEL
jgi:hypothetical protein